MPIGRGNGCAADFSRQLRTRIPWNHPSGVCPAVRYEPGVEDFVYQRLRRLARQQEFAVHRQTSRALWGKTKVRPDIVVELPDGGGNVVIDTKWKVLTHHRPAAQDLHQLYVYNQLFQAQRGILLYPDVHRLAAHRHPFEGPGHSYAQVDFVTITDSDHIGINPSLDESLLRLLR